MLYRLLADALVVLHGAFVLFVVFGGFLVLWKTRLAWLHIPAALWGTYIEFTGKICPLTPLENHFRQLAGERGYAEGFIEHYLIPLMYPDGLTQDIQTMLGLVVLAINLVAYGLVMRRMFRSGG